jgi:hypothetical protein
VPTPNTNFAAKLGTFTVAIPTVYVVDKVSDDDDFVTTPGEMTLREAIRLANNDGQPSQIEFSKTVFAAPQTITISPLNGEMFITKDVTIIGPSSKLTIDAAGTGRIFNINDDTNSGNGIFISNMVLTNGSVLGVSGGAIFVQDDPLTLSNVSITNSSSNVSGGAIQLEAGGATLTLNDCIITGNQATGANAYKVGDGGAINVFGNASLFINRSTLSGNTATGQGGAIYWTNGGALNLVDSTIANNTAAGNVGGGGLYFWGTIAANGFNIINSTISGNKATGGPGGGIELNTLTGTANIRNSTITNNESLSGGGGVDRTGGGGLITLSSTIVAGNKSAGSGAVARADVSASAAMNVSGNDNLVGVMDAANLITLTGTGNQVGTTATPLNAKLGALANNGGPTLTHALLAGSPALNKGNNSFMLSFDQRGTGFNRVVGGTADIGAFEDQTVVAPPPQVLGAVQIDNGTSQRSMVRSLVVNFNEPVNYSAASFQLIQTFNGTGSVGLTLSPATGPASSVTITFNNTGTVVLNGQNSLPDGKFEFRIVANNVTGVGGTLDGNKNGTSQGSPIDDVVTNLHRLFGDSNGDGAVTAVDFQAFFLAYNNAPPGSIFDFDGNGSVTAIDFQSFFLRYGQSGFLP